MKHDYHIHTYFSGDSDTRPEDTIEQAIRLGLKTICITEHHDMDFPDESNPFSLDTEAYLKEYALLKEKYHGQIDIRTGVELGLQPHLAKELDEYSKAYPFDFIIGSTHVVKKADPYYPEFWEKNPSYDDIVIAYLTDTLNSIKAFQNFDVYGHLDYIVRYRPDRLNRPETSDLYLTYPDLIDEILKELIYNGKGIEINTGGLFHLPFANPHKKILTRYRKLGGEILTTGSDGHTPERIAHEFDKLPELLGDCGFKYTTIFKNRKPEWIKL
ncbi:MAG: histidinol-phosphatase HisJ family protein [Lachnospiraceae bacterium]|nr:histidinol-phosphatase HisJ family protein [Lachnospiraceae bacterium]